MLAIVDAFVKRREPTYESLTYSVHPTSIAVAPERFAPDHSPDFDPTEYSRFLGGRGRPVYPASQDVLYYRNPWTAIGGEGSSWMDDHFNAGKAVIPSSLLAVGRTRAINYPRTEGKFPWAERANSYRPPYQSFSELSDSQNVDPEQPDDWNGQSDYVSEPY